MDGSLQDPDDALEDLMRYDRIEWQEWGEDEGEYESEGEYEGGEKAKEIESVTRLESIPDFGIDEVEKRRQSILRRRAEKKIDAFRRLLAGSKKKKQTPSVETIVTLEDDFHTESLSSSSSSRTYPCFKSIDISDSQLKLLNLFKIYPIPDDPGNVRAFWTLYDPVPNYIDDGIERFIDTMRKLNLKPIACMSDLLRSDLLNLRYYGLDPRAVKVVCESLYNNASVQSLDLKDNWLTPDACLSLSNLLIESEIIVSMKLSGCKIGCEGIKSMLPGITESWSLVELDLSHCRLEDEGFNCLASVIENDQRIQILNLADNQLGIECAQALQAMLAHNNNLRILNLSWNNLFAKEASNGLFKGLLQNQTLLSVDLSWNAFSKENLAPLGAFLRENQTLETLDLSGNEFDEQAGVTIAKSLRKNVGLKELYLGNNPLKATGGSAIIHALIPEQSPETNLLYVDLENLWVHKDVLPDIEKMTNDRPWLQVKIGGIYSHYKTVGPDEKKIFFKRANFEGMKPKKKKQRRDFGHFILSLEDKLITKGDFRQLVKGFKIKLSESLVDALMAAFPGANKKVDQAAMKTLYLQLYPDTKAPPPAVLRGKKKGKGMKEGGKKRRERVDDKDVEIKGKSKKRRGIKTVKLIETPFSESYSEGETSDEFKGGEAYEDL